MNNRLLLAVVVLAALTGAVVTTMRSHESESVIEKPAATLPAVKKEDITAIEIENPSKVNVSLQKQDGKWRVTAPVSAAADQSAIDSVLDKLGELEVTGVAAARKENHARLEVDAAKAIRVKAKAGDKQLIDLYVGASKSGGTMVRAEGQDQVLAVRGSIRYAFDKEVKLFRDRVILDVEPKEFASLVISSAKGTFKFEKAGADAKWAQAKGEKPIQRFSDTKVQSLVFALGRLRAADFADANETAETTGLNAPTASATMTKADGTSVTLELGKQHANGTEYYLRASGKDLIFRVTKFNAERLLADASAFQEAAKKEGEAAAEPAPMPDLGPGGGQIPPEVLKQLQQQMGAHGGHGGSPH